MHNFELASLASGAGMTKWEEDLGRHRHPHLHPSRASRPLQPACQPAIEKPE
jgi:hypothetical protein